MLHFDQTMLTVGILLVSTAPLDAQSVEPEAAESQRIIVLLNGRVVSGSVEDVPGGYVVDSSVGSMVIPYSQVRLTAKDLPDAYRKLKAGMMEPTAGQHVAIGQWCYENRLYTSAREQAKAALLLEPERKEARSLLRDIEKVSSGHGLAATVSPRPSKTRDGFSSSPPQALGGLSPATTRDFVRKIQPLLMNKCGNARCHGVAGTSDFRLTPVRVGSSGFRSLTDQNISSVLRIIDAERPDASPLLVVPQGNHGGKGRIWIGPRAEDQQSELREWTERAALERTLTPTDEGASTLAGSDSLRTASGVESHASVKPDSFLDGILAEERPDKFDPAIFNRLTHGRE